jgi:hypothetical protein
MNENLKLLQMYLQREKNNHKTDTSKSVAENLAEYVSISLRLDKVTAALEYLSDL